MNFLQKLFDNNERDVARYRKIVDKVNALEESYKKLTDEELYGKTEVFRARYREEMEKQGGIEALYEREQNASASGNSKDKHVYRDAINKALDVILPDAFAVRM